MTTTLTLDSKLGFQWDARISRYRYRGGVGDGRLAPREAVINLTRGYIRSRSVDLQSLADRLYDKEITLTQFQREAAETLRDIHLNNAAVARGGHDRLTLDDKRSVAQELQRQFRLGKDEATGKAYGLRSLVEELREGKVSRNQLRARLGAYGESGKKSFWAIDEQVNLEKGRSFAVRRLGAAEHCASCPGHQRLTPVPVDQIVRPMERCECGVRCKCTLQYLSLEEAIALGMKDPRISAKRQRELEEVERLGFGRRRRR